MSMKLGRALHFVLKVGDRGEFMHFLKGSLGMKILRHEEFDSGCKATCNGPYQNKWSKTMIGYGPEDSNFVLEITYNYPVDKYRLGNDILGITIGAPNEKISKIVEGKDWIKADGKYCHASSAGYKFYLETSETLGIKEVSLSSSNLENSEKFWNGLLGMSIVSKTDQELILSYDEQKQAKLRLVSTQGKEVDHATAFGRIAFSIPTNELPDVESKIKNAEGLGKVKTPRVVLDTPGKADVEVVILEDPDDHEICFVGEEGFAELSQVDPNGDKLLDEALEADKSKEWYEKKKLSKEEAQ